MTRYTQQASHFYSFIMSYCPSYQRFAVGTKDAIPKVRQPLED
ncbi:zinc resistance-associated protein [Escherichia coli]|uniref:Zinc resistance-associated protein n=1 Tax=Escherichia coli TaxID=562 RepID=A0A2K3TLE9_ECOLX|nr:zinc resistance-associated protein [Escherichia coli]